MKWKLVGSEGTGSARIIVIFINDLNLEAAPPYVNVARTGSGQDQPQGVT